ncbi:7 transmembrane receptor [Onchocerca flexuosa]|uniref:7 transmembrane receptor n=1 Tax=Onchocerca flexuosa TaxID=387005 RepID=A0A238BIC0_9BILA|nr:7 transmembrane receptor [Onchocerca flexuosa]
MVMHVWHSGFLILVLLIMMIVFGNLVVLLAVLIDRELRRLATNKFIASLAISDLLVGIVVMPLSLYATINEIHWDLGDRWCQFHLVTGVFSTTASIIHLTAISLDRYFAIMFPTEYQRHSIATSTFPYIIMIWLVSFAVSSTLFMEKSLDEDGYCWIKNPQYLVLSSLLSFFIPGAIVVYLYVKIFRKLRSHRLYIFGQLGLLKRQQNNSTGQKSDKTECLPKVTIEERGIELSQTGSIGDGNNRTWNGTLGKKFGRPSNQSNLHLTAAERRCSSPVIFTETLKQDRLIASKKRVSITLDPPSMELAAITVNYQSVGAFPDNQCLLLHHVTPLLSKNPPENPNIISDEDLLKPLVTAKTRSDSVKLPVVSVSFNDLKTLDDAGDSGESLPAVESSMFLALPKTVINFPATVTPTAPTTVSLKVPKWDCCTTPTSMAYSNSSRSSCTSTSDSGDIPRRISMNSYDTSITEDGIDSIAEGPNARTAATWSALRTAVQAHNLISLTTTKDQVTDTVPAPVRRGAISRGKLRKIAIQVTRAIRRKRRESMAIRRETRATGVVAAILIAFLICWIPYFCITVYRGICSGLSIQVDKNLHVNLFMLSSWLGYAHSCFNPIIYTCLNKNFRRTIKHIICYLCHKSRKDL